MIGGALLLAAGNSRRFGSDKRLHVENQLPMLVTTLRLYQPVFDNLAIVIRVEDDAIVDMLAEYHLTPNVLFAPQAELGMGHSLAAGISQLKHWDYVFVGLADMPFIQATSLEKIHRTLPDRNHIVQPTTDGVVGHPVGFGARYFTELEQLSGDRGARTIVDRHAEHCLLVEINDPGITRDRDLNLGERD